MLEQPGRPKWDDVTTYAVDLKNACYRQWAWEFLRRNPKYQFESTNALDNSSATHCKEVARKYGLRDLVHFLDAYVPGKPELVWLSEVIRDEPITYAMDGKPQILELNKGDVALVFDLDATLEVGPAAIDALLYDARLTLMNERQNYLNSLHEERRMVRVKTPKIRKAKLFTWLRIFDAVEFSRKSIGDVALAMYPDCFKVDPYTQKTQELKARKSVSADLKRAKSLVDGEYLTLIPLDYLQDKSKRG